MTYIFIVFIIGGRPPVLLDGQFLKGRDGPNSSAHVMDGQKFGQRFQKQKEA